MENGQFQVKIFQNWSQLCYMGQYQNDKNNGYSVQKFEKMQNKFSQYIIYSGGGIYNQEGLNRPMD
ncbi:unnamed protein product [Paramecium sonneborni]|uniref:Uncharacterized protein n=1 Tax=Paramecium sonneborni TaxID=65129 RepID=A0A8S1RUH8_9CILI|nr:unnamed protein product [Paramecium sonneborni]